MTGKSKVQHMKGSPNNDGAKKQAQEQPTTKQLFKVGTKIEAKDYLGEWYPAKIMKQRNGKKEVLVHYDGWNSRFDVWLPVSGDKIRIPKSVIKNKIKEKDWHIGDRVVAKWGPAGKTYPATISKIISQATVEVIFYDGFKKVIHKTSLKPDREKLYRQFEDSLRKEIVSPTTATESATPPLFVTPTNCDTTQRRAKRRLTEPSAMADYVTSVPRIKRSKSTLPELNRSRSSSPKSNFKRSKSTSLSENSKIKATTKRSESRGKNKKKLSKNKAEAVDEHLPHAKEPQVEVIKKKSRSYVMFPVSSNTDELSLVAQTDCIPDRKSKNLIPLKVKFPFTGKEKSKGSPIDSIQTNMPDSVSFEKWPDSQQNETQHCVVGSTSLSNTSLIRGKEKRKIKPTPKLRELQNNELRKSLVLSEIAKEVQEGDEIKTNSLKKGGLLDKLTPGDRTEMLAKNRKRRKIKLSKKVREGQESIDNALKTPAERPKERSLKNTPTNIKTGNESYEGNVIDAETPVSKGCTISSTTEAGNEHSSVENLLYSSQVPTHEVSIPTHTKRKVKVSRKVQLSRKVSKALRHSTGKKHSERSSNETGSEILLGKNKPVTKFEDKYELFKVKWKAEKDKRRRLLEEKSKPSPSVKVENAGLKVEQNSKRLTKEDCGSIYTKDVIESNNTQVGSSDPKLSFIKPQSFVESTNDSFRSPDDNTAADSKISSETEVTLKKDVIDNKDKHRPKIKITPGKEARENKSNEVAILHNGPCESAAADHVKQQDNANVSLTEKVPAKSKTRGWPKGKPRKKKYEDREYFPDGFTPDTSRTPNFLDTISFASMVQEERPSQRSRPEVFVEPELSVVKPPLPFLMNSPNTPIFRTCFPTAAQIVAARIQKRVHQKKMASMNNTDNPVRFQEDLAGLQSFSAANMLMNVPQNAAQNQVARLSGATLNSPNAIITDEQESASKKQSNELDLTDIKLSNGLETSQPALMKKRKSLNFITSRLQYKHKMEELKYISRQNEIQTAMFSMAQSPHYGNSLGIRSHPLKIHPPPTNSFFPASGMLHASPTVTALSTTRQTNVSQLSTLQIHQNKFSQSNPCSFGAPSTVPQFVQQMLQTSSNITSVSSGCDQLVPASNFKPILPKTPTLTTVQGAGVIANQRPSSVDSSARSTILPSGTSTVPLVGPDSEEVNDKKRLPSKDLCLSKKKSEKRKKKLDEELDISKEEMGAKKANIDVENGKGIRVPKELTVGRQPNVYKCRVPGCHKSFRKLRLLEYHHKCSHTLKPLYERNRSSVSGSTTKPDPPVVSVTSDESLDQHKRENQLATSGGETGTESESEIETEEEISIDDCVKCICEDECDTGFMIQCEQCFTWQHGECVGYSHPKAVPLYYLCHICAKPKGLRKSQLCTNDFTWFRFGRLQPVIEKSAIGEDLTPTSSDEEVMDALVLTTHGIIKDLYNIQNILQNIRRTFTQAKEVNHPFLSRWVDGLPQTDSYRTSESMNNKLVEEICPTELIDSGNFTNKLLKSEDLNQNDVSTFDSITREVTTIPSTMATSVDIVNKILQNTESEINLRYTEKSTKTVVTSTHKDQNQIQKSDNGINSDDKSMPYMENSMPYMENSVNWQKMKTEKKLIANNTEFRVDDEPAFSAESSGNELARIFSETDLTEASRVNLAARCNLLGEVEKVQKEICERLEYLNKRYNELETEYLSIESASHLVEDFKTKLGIPDLKSLLKFLNQLKWTGFLEKSQEDKIINVVG